MKRLLRLAGGILVPIFAVSACTPSRPSGPYRVQIPFNNPDGSYSVQKIEVATLQDPSAMQGTAATLRVHRGPLGPVPKADFVTDSDGALIPADFNTLQMAVAYAHMERLMYLEQSLGFSAIVPHPRSVTVEFPMNDDFGKPLSDNAFYYPSWDSLVILPFKGRDIPVGINAGVLAHEHFHSIFQHTLGMTEGAAGLSIEEDKQWADGPAVQCEQRMRSLTSAQTKPKSSDRRMLNMVLMRALNEGLADFWGWLYTRDEAFISKSLPYLGEQRVVAAKAKHMPDKKFFEELSKIDHVPTLVEASYCLGTYFARFMREMAEQEGATEIAVRLLTRLEAARAHGRIEIGPDMLVSIMFPEESDLTQLRCALIKSFASEPQEIGVVAKACPPEEP